jgi:hypothetical protein
MLILTNTTVTTTVEYLVPVASFSSVHSSTPAADTTQHSQDTPLTVNGLPVDTTDSTPLPAATSIFSPSASSPTHSVPDIVFNTAVDPASTVRTVMPDHVTEGDGKATKEHTTVADVNTVEQVTKTSSVTPSSFFRQMSPGFLLIVTVFVFSSVFLTVIVVLLVRARSQHELCWTQRRCYLPVTSPHQNGCGDHRVEASSTLSPELAPLTSV